MLATFFLKRFNYYRVLLANIRNLGKCPCPRCTVPKTWIKDLGTANDSTRRQSLRRVYDHPLKYSIRKARDVIYRLGSGIKSKAVENMLSPLSYVPTMVCQLVKISILDLLRYL